MNTEQATDVLQALERMERHTLQALRMSQLGQAIAGRDERLLECIEEFETGVIDQLVKLEAALHQSRTGTAVRRPRPLLTLVPRD